MDETLTRPYPFFFLALYTWKVIYVKKLYHKLVNNLLKNEQKMESGQKIEQSDFHVHIGSSFPPSNHAKILIPYIEQILPKIGSYSLAWILS